MDKEEITNTGICQSFEWRQCDSLEDSGPKKALIILATSPSPCAAHDHQDISKDEKMALAPYSCSRYD